MLTTADNKVTLDGGYYEAITISTDMPDIPGTISYLYHHHSNGSDGIIDNNVETPDAYGDNYQSTTAAGCFTKSTKVASAWCDGRGVVDTKSNGDVWIVCSKCGRAIAAQSAAWVERNGIPYGAGTACGKVTAYKTVYTRSCGRLANQIIGASIIYD